MTEKRYGLCHYGRKGLD